MAEHGCANAVQFIHSNQPLWKIRFSINSTKNKPAYYSDAIQLPSPIQYKNEILCLKKLVFR